MGRGLRKYRGKTVIVNLVDGGERAFRGVLVDVTQEQVVLDDVTVVEPRQVPLDGLAVIPLHNVSWVQVV